MLIWSIVATSTAATAHAIACSRIRGASFSRVSRSSSLESLSPRMRYFGSRITAAATTGPNSEPRPTSSTPATMQAPASHARFSKRRVQRRLFSRRSLAAGERGGFFRFFLDALFSTEGTGEVLLASSPSALWKGKGGGRVAASFQLRRELKIVRAGGCRINNGNNFSFEVLA